MTAQDFLTRHDAHGLNLKVKLATKQSCPAWPRSTLHYVGARCHPTPDAAEVLAWLAHYYENLDEKHCDPAVWKRIRRFFTDAELKELGEVG